MDEKFTIGIREIVKGIKANELKRVTVAKNCPDFLIDSIKDAGCLNITVFAGNQKELGTKLGKPFAIACVGYADLDKK